MNTQCPSCKTVFAVKEAQLDAHHGLVRCGKCRDIFNASWNLVDGATVEASAPAESSPVPEPDTGYLPPPPPEADPRKAMLELLGDVDPEVEAQMLADEPPRGPDTENEPLPPVTDVNDDVAELELEIEQRLHRPAAADSDDEAGDEWLGPTRDQIEIELPEDFSDFPQPDEAQEAAATDESDDLELRFEEDEVFAERSGPTELPAPPPHDDADEEIIIEAPPALWGAFEDEAGPADEDSGDQEAAAAQSAITEDPATTADEPGPSPPRRAAMQPSEPRHAPVRVTSGDSTTVLSRSSTLLADDVRMVEIPEPRRIKSWVWVLGGILLLLLILWQVKIFYFDDLAQSQSIRPVLLSVCGVMGCEVPPRSAPKLIQLSETRIYQHPEVPGALQVAVNLVNQAEFAQVMPPLEVTLTDKAGQVVGRRTYRASEYHAGKPAELDPKVERSVFIDLAQPSRSAVGYEVQLVGR